MNKVAFCAVSGNGMSALAQIMLKKGYEVYGSDQSFDAGRDHASGRYQNHSSGRQRHQR